MPNGVFAAFAMLYPLALAFGQAWVSAHMLAWALLVLAALRLITGPRDRVGRLVAVAAGLIAIVSLLGGGAASMKYYPVIVNLSLLGLFGFSVLFPPTVIERLARLQEPDLPAAAIPYVRRVTLTWCAFFAANGAIALMTALWASDAVWALYNGCIAYLAMGALFAGEWLVRQRVKRRQGGV